MKTKYLDEEILKLQAYNREGDLSDRGVDVLAEYLEIKKIINDNKLLK